MYLNSARFRIPVVAVVCAFVFLGYGLWTTGQQLVVCDRFAPNQVQCQVNRSLLFGAIPTVSTQFWLQDVAINSTMCDNTPRGGVRFCHRVTLLGNNLSPNSLGHRVAQALPEMRTPLSAATVHDKFLRFMQGEGNQQLSFTMASQLTTYLRTGLLGLLLAIVAWGFWDVQWPPVAVSPLAMDGAEDGDA